ncbi:hypothetical protein CQA53_10205 [Helicobacter didelphidarum]|uniref:Uncharacterized protein n=1 Tax=Helicobacter didelphidarum TaxID=2040648 RepID=A0A3D8I892_9HELI|nr:hypothetical protein [Helicobacter didelphidarum]RDU61390.1 hypothetical protein CQA53_10205 [Helicobacter didelphidarum]
MTDEENIYRGLRIESDDFTYKQQSQEKDFGIVGEVASGALGAGGAYAEEKIKVIFDENDNKGRFVASKIVKVNIGILDILYKKLEQKSNEKIAKELVVEGISGYIATKSIETGFAIRAAAKETGKRVSIRAGLGIAARVFTGIGAGALAGSGMPIIGTIAGAVIGGIIATRIEDMIFEDEKNEQEKIKQFNEEVRQRKLKIARVADYLLRNKYIELRILDDIESETLCKEASNLKSSYFKTILLMQSFPNYLDRDKAFYDTLQQKELDTSKDSKERISKETDKAQSKEPKITPIANAIPLTIEIEKCYDGASGNLLKNTTIYLYNHRFKRVVAKGQSDERGKLIVHNVYVGQENTIDKVSFVVDRENFDERVA